MNALWNEKFSGSPLIWSKEDDAVFEKRINTFRYVFEKRYMALSEEAQQSCVSNGLIARYLLSLDDYDYYNQDGACRVLGFRGDWGRKLLTNAYSCKIVSQMVDKLCDYPPNDIYESMEKQIGLTVATYPDHHDARYYILKYPNSLQARRGGYNKIWLENCWDRKNWNTYYVSIYATEEKWSGYGISMFESLLAHASQYSIDCWEPKLSNGIEFRNGRDRHGWRIYYGKNASREAISDFLQILITNNNQKMAISPAKDDDNFVFVDVIGGYDLIEAGVLLLEYLKDYPQTN